MSKSVIQMLHELFTRVAALEAKAKESAVTIVTPVVLDKPAKPDRSLCPKCGVKPAYFFHVKNCTGQKEEKQDADTIRRRDQGTT